MSASRQQRLALLPHQLEELACYRAGPRKGRPSANLVRRNLLMHVGRHGETMYALTEFGRAALRANEPEPPSIPEEAIYPRDEEHRYRIYARHGDQNEVLAVAGSPAALGIAIVQLDEDERERGRRLVDLGAIGVLDAVQGRWVISPWHRPEPERAALLRVYEEADALLAALPATNPYGGRLAQAVGEYKRMLEGR